MDEAFDKLQRFLMRHHMVPQTRAGDQGAGHREDAWMKENSG